MQVHVLKLHHHHGEKHTGIKQNILTHLQDLFYFKNVLTFT